MLMKIGDTTEKFGISRRSLHYWDNMGILKSDRGENDYRYYDEENLIKIKQIVLLRKLRMSIPSIQEIFTSDELSKVITVFTNHLDETKKETKQLDALGIVLQQLLNMLKDRQDMDSIYKYLDTTNRSETEELKIALKTVLSESVKEIKVEIPPETIVDMAGIDLSLELMTVENIDVVTKVVKHCYANTKDIDELLGFYNFKNQLNMPECTFWYKIMQVDKCVGAVNLEYGGRESMIIRNIAYIEPDNNIYIFELLKQKHHDVLCWQVYLTSVGNNITCHQDYEAKKQQFLEDNGFVLGLD